MSIKEPHSRNPTPNFIKFKKSSPQSKHSENRNSERSSSRASKCSFEYYEKRVLKNTVIKYSPYSKEKSSQKTLDTRVNKFMKNANNHRSNSNTSDKPRQSDSSASTRGRQSVKKKRASGSNSASKPKSPRRNQLSLQKEEIRAKQQRTEVMKVLMKNQKVPALMNKIKLKKEDAKKGRGSDTKKGFFNDPTIQTKDISFLNNYEIYGQLGKGAYGVVRMAYDKKRNDKVAIKIYEKLRIDEPNKLRNIERQISIQARVSHPTIAKIIQTIQTPHELYLILEYGGANSLYKYILSKPQHRLQQEQVKQFFKTLVEAIQHLHSQGIVHRDIKAQNILINRQHKLKLIDFGFSLVSSPPSIIDTFCGTPTYMAPEIVSRTDHIAMYTDVWSLGILLYVLLQGNYPFRGRTEEQLFQKIRRGVFSFINEDVSAGSKSMIRRLLVVNPMKRPALKDLLVSGEWKQWVGS